jgi:hypothetical protein
MKNYNIYNISTGEILSTISCDSSQIEAQLKTGLAYLEGDKDNALYYVVDGIYTPKGLSNISVNKFSIMANGLDYCEITGIKIGSVVRVGSFSGICEDGLFSFSSDAIGSYVISISHPSMLLKEVSINAF